MKEISEINNPSISPFFPLEKGEVVLPDHFPDPFQEQPHPIAQCAAEHLMRRLAQLPCFHPDRFEGKMLGVLVVLSPDQKQLGYLAAFSGYLPPEDMQKSSYLGFVPPIYNLTDPNGFFKQEEPQISALNLQLQRLENDPTYQSHRQAYKLRYEQFESELQAYKKRLRIQKLQRQERRQQADTSPAELDRLVRASQHEKAEFKRWSKAQQAILAELQANYQDHEKNILALKQERSTRSLLLEQRIFQAFRLTNGWGEWNDIHTLAPMAPGGTGECAAPRLLQYAWIHHYQPIALAEFWWGAAPEGELRRHGHFYPACRGKCGLILPFQMRGLLTATQHPTEEFTLSAERILFEDEDLLILNKPSGCLSLPGKDGSISALEALEEQLHISLYPVHRLDRDTSGLLLFAKHPASQRTLQEQFQQQRIHKEYLAILETIPQQEEGCISLPIAPDWINRPRQQVDYQNGKTAITQYRILAKDTTRNLTKVLFLPQTGRTHQLRVHAAHPCGLNAPILGDPLYGTQTTSGQMRLHASRISFLHPTHQTPITVFAKAHASFSL